MGNAAQAQSTYGIGVELVAKQLLTATLFKGVIQILHQAAELVGEEAANDFAGSCIGVQHGFSGREATQFVYNMVCCGMVKIGGAEFPCGNFAECNAAAVGFCVVVYRADIVGAAFVQHGAGIDGTGCDDANNITLYDALCLCRVFRLLADGDFITLADQLCNIYLRCVVGDTAHGGAVFGVLHVAVSGGQSNVQLSGCGSCVVVEHFVKVAQTEKQHAVLVLGLDFVILFFHGGWFCHK